MGIFLLRKGLKDFAGFYLPASPPCWGCRKSQNPLTAKLAKNFRQGRKGLFYMDLTLRSLRIL